MFNKPARVLVPMQSTHLDLTKCNPLFHCWGSAAESQHMHCTVQQYGLHHCCYYKHNLLFIFN